MKSNVYYVIFLLTFLALLMLTQMTFARQRAALQDNGDSLEETQKWIKDTLIERSSFTTNYPEERFNSTIRVEEVNFDGCDILIKHVSTGRTPGRSSYSAKLSDLDALNIKVMRVKGSLSNKYYVLINAVEMKRSVRYRSKGIGLKLDRMMNYMGEYFSDEEIANRVAKAFARAIRLCSERRI